MTLTPLRVQTLLAQEPRRLDDGRLVCQICDKPYTTLGPHQLLHRREVGLAPPMPTNRNGGTVPDRLACPDCDEVMSKTSLRPHLMSKHGHTGEAASFRA